MYFIILSVGIPLLCCSDNHNPYPLTLLPLAPCDPRNLAADQDCLSGVVTVTWGASAGANYYTVLAEANGHMDSCNSTSTFCELTQLQCGVDYTVTVLAGDGNCNSSVLAKTNITTGKESEAGKTISSLV